MTTFSKKVSIRWADLDPNFHMRHSVYYDFGAQHRMEVLTQLGLSIKTMQEQNLDQFFFVKNVFFRKEIHLNDDITMTTKISKIRADASRWTIVHELKNQDDVICAIISVDGAWMDTKLRKLATPTPTVIVDVMNSIPKTEDFILL